MPHSHGQRIWEGSVYPAMSGGGGGERQLQGGQGKKARGGVLSARKGKLIGKEPREQRHLTSIGKGSK